MKKASLLAITGLFPFVVFSQPSDLLNNFLNETKQASGAFEQQTFQKDGKPAEELQEGTFSFSRPGKFVWTYTSPYPQRMVCDGSRIYIWDEDLNQVTVRSAKGAIPKSPASILFGTQSYKKDWNAAQPKQEDGYIWITLTPKAKDASVSSVSFGFKSEKLEKLIFVGSMGEKTNLTISDLKTDVQLSLETFKFTAPKGADVIEVK